VVWLKSYSLTFKRNVLFVIICVHVHACIHACVGVDGCVCVGRGGGVVILLTTAEQCKCVTPKYNFKWNGNTLNIYLFQSFMVKECWC
jgi:hypothetical protein